MARQYPRKHIGALIQAFGLIHTRVPHARLRIVGDGPEHAALITLANHLQLANKITFTGSISDEAVKHEYAQCDVFCLPSVQEGFGIVFLEAMAASKPIVSTTAAAIGEVVRHGETGVLVPPNDVHALAGALLFLLGNKEIRTHYGMNGQRRLQQYDWQQVAETFLHEVERITYGRTSVFALSGEACMTDTSLQAQINQLNGWTHADNMIRKTFRFTNFTEAVGWTVRVAFLAEAHAHHPDIDIRYNRVTLALTTHDAGNQVTQKDVALAQAIDQVKEQSNE